MRVSKITLIVLVCIIVLSIFVAKISNILAIKYEEKEVVERKGEDVGSRDIEIDESLVLGDSADHLMWFVQISDIHVSVFHDPNRISEFRDFCNVTIDAIKPTVVIASGDLADAKEVDNMGSRQFKQEWIYYSDILKETHITNRTMWLDIRGNHDNFNVPSIDKESSYYHEYSIQGKKHKRSYMYTIKKGYEKYSFVAIDACLDPGPRRPLNFIGRITPDEFQLLEQFEKESRGSNATVWFGHYPSSCTISPAPGLRKLLKSGVAYLCGHLHTLGGTVPNMYTLQQTGFLELELGDWKENRLFRVAAFDHGLFSFIDKAHGEWPIILVTNPKHALFALPHKEPLQLLSKSTHVRILVFSPSPLEAVRFKIDDDDWVDCRNAKGPLFVAKWDPLKYASGVHQISVYARNLDGQHAETVQPFALDGSRLHFRLLPRVTLMTDATTLFHSVFVALVLISVIPLVTLRIMHYLVREKRLILPEIRSIPGSWFVRRVWIVCSINKLFYPLICYPIYLTFGPWFIGEVIDGHYGAAFAWGTYVDGKILPGAFSYFYGCFQLFWFHLPFVVVLSHCVDLRFRMICLDGRFCSYTSQVWNNLPCAILIFFQAVFAYFFYLAYGTMALFLGPLRTWSVFMGLYLWYFSATLDQRDLVEAKLVWGNRECYNAINNGGNSHEM